MNRDLFSAAVDAPHLDAVDWASTPLGPVDGWSPTLRNTVDLMLHSRFPMTLMWGPEFVMVYNDAYVPMIGDKHPAALGTSARTVFAEAWDQIDPMMTQVAQSGVAQEVRDGLVPLQRHGFLEDCYFTFCYSAVRGSEGLVEGVIDVVAETTDAVMGRRRVEVLARLSESLVDATSVEAVRTAALTVLRTFADDLVDADLRLAGSEPGQWSPSLPIHPPAPLPTRAHVVDEGPDARTAWVRVEPESPEHGASTLAVCISPRVVLDDDLRDLVTLMATVVGRALGRVRADVAWRVQRDLERRLSETLQRSLLTRPAQLDDVQIGVRYVPAASEAQVGGDWYDAFVRPNGDLAVVIGDVTGHDREAAAAMAQVRNLLRGVSMSQRLGPAAILSSLERAIEGLAIDVFATGILAHVEPAVDGSDGGPWTLRWSNAGHPAPVMIGPDGSVELLLSRPDPLLGVGDFARHDHVVEVPAGATVVLYTDGLIERRGELLDEGFAWVQRVLAGRQGLDAEQVCDLLIEHMPPGVEDDVALLVMTTGPVRGASVPAAGALSAAG